MHHSISLYALTGVSILAGVIAAPIPAPYNLTNPTSGPIPGQSSLYTDYIGVAAPWPGNTTDAVSNTTHGAPGADDVLFQNLLSAEWIIFSFYQTAVEMFNKSSFVEAGFLNTTYQRITEIRDNEAGHLRIFQDQISSNSVKPGPCKYAFPFTDPTVFLALETLLESSSMAFLTGLAIQAKLNSSKSALVAIGETESRHNTWSLIDVWGVSPFAGPSDTAFPYANQILSTTNAFVIPGSCPKHNPVQYPSPDQNLPTFSAVINTKSLAPGSPVVYNFSNPANQPSFKKGKEYYAVFFHGVENITMPFNTTTNATTIPPQFDQLGVIVAVIADQIGAPTEDSVVAGPGILLQQPSILTVQLAT